MNFGPGYNVEHGLASAHNRSRLQLSKPTATLRGDTSGKRPACGPHTQGSHTQSCCCSKGGLEHEYTKRAFVHTRIGIHPQHPTQRSQAPEEPAWARGWLWMHTHADS